MNLQRYLDHTGYVLVPRPDPGTLRGLLAAHVTRIPFENLDIQLGRHVDISPKAAFDKLVTRARGGWCYEHNGLFGRVLQAIGFEVTRVAASVMRKERGGHFRSNHLCLLVRCGDSPQHWLVDAGFGGSMLDPLPLREGEYEQPPFRVGLRRLEDGLWQFWEDLGDGEFCYDFADQPADERALSACAESLQSDPESSFVRNLVVQLRTPSMHLSLRGRVLRTASPDGIGYRTLGSADELVATLADRFGLRVPEAASLWPRVLKRHAALKAERP